MTSSTPASDPSAPTAAYRRALGGLTITLLISWVLMLSPLPYSLFAGVTGVIAAVFLVLVAVSGWQQGRRTTALAALLFGLPAIGVMLLSSVTSAIFYQPMLERQECYASALTEEARSACDQQVQESLSGWATRLLGG